MSAALTGMRFGFEQEGTALGDIELGHVVIAIDPGLFGDPRATAKRVATYIDAAQSLSGNGRTVHAAGGPQWRERADRDANGIPVPDALRDELNQMAHGLSLPPI
jgi:LDH2 family malate/lactate/ureidoglycolate dehydrogenase